jgi:tetratricopeptide (TPR) repeat protein
MAGSRRLSYAEDPAGIAERLKRARIAAGLAQRELSFPGCTPAYISRIEKGERVPSAQILREFARRLGVSESYLANGREAPREEARLVEARAALRVGDVATARELIDRDLARATRDRERAEASALYGEVALYESDVPGAIDALERARLLHPAIERESPDVAEALGRAYARANEYESAIGVFLDAYHAACERDDLLTRIRFGALLANSYTDTGNFAAAEAILGEVISVSGGLDDPLGRARIYWAQSRMHALKRDEDTAARYAEKALEVLEVSNQAYYAALAHQLLAHVEIDRGNADRAIELLDQAQPLIDSSGRPFERASFQLERARALMNIGRQNEAASLAMATTAVLEQASPLDAGRGYVLVADVFEELGDEERALELYELGIERLETIPSRYLVEAYSKLAELLEARGDAERALTLLRRAMQAQARAGRPL